MDIFDLADDEDEEESEEDEKDDEDKDNDRKEDNGEEPPARTLRAFLNTIRFILQKPGTAKRSAKKTYTKHCIKAPRQLKNSAPLHIAAQVANFLQPFVPKRYEKNNLPDINIFNDVAIAKICNKIVSILQPQQNIWAMFPNVDEERSLRIGSAALYNMMWKFYDIFGADGKPITDQVTATRNPRQYSGAFLMWTNLKTSWKAEN